MKLEPVAWQSADVDDGRVVLTKTRDKVMSKELREVFNIPLYAIPPGYVLVKAEPDEAMIRAGEKIDWVNDGDTRASVINMYQAMIAAAMIEGEQ